MVFFEISHPYELFIYKISQATGIYKRQFKDKLMNYPKLCITFWYLKVFGWLKLFKLDNMSNRKLGMHLV